MNKKLKKERKFLGYVKNPFWCNKKEKVYKIVVYQTPKNIVFLLADTCCQIIDSEYCIELQMYFENGILIEVEELNGAYIFPF